MRYFAIGAAFALAGGAASAQDCTADGAAYELNAEAVVALYDCIEARMAEAYAAEGSAVGAAYRDWQVTSTRPAAPGPHGDRLLQTFANDLAAPQYLKFEEEGFTMPAGAALAKESIAVGDGIAEVGPLFIMEKAAAGEAPDAGDWVYSALQPDGKPMGISQSFCADCHMGWSDRDSLAYPAEEVRLTQ